MQANTSKCSWVSRGQQIPCRHHSWGSKGSHKQWGKHQIQANTSKGRHKMQAKRGHHSWGSKGSYKQWGKQVQAKTSKGRH
jgi:hypothetical protein